MFIVHATRRPSGLVVLRRRAGAGGRVRAAAAGMAPVHALRIVRVRSVDLELELAVRMGGEDLWMLSEHLFYEVQMTFGLAASLVTPGPAFDLPTQNARIETFPIHVRQLIDFLWMEKERYGQPRPLFAADYFALGEWAKLRHERPEVLNEALRHKIGWGIAHLTYKRAWSTKQDKEWQPVALSCALAPAVICFVDNVNSAKLDPAWPPVVMKAHAETFLERFGGARGDA